MRNFTHPAACVKWLQPCPSNREVFNSISSELETLPASLLTFPVATQKKCRFKARNLNKPSHVRVGSSLASSWASLDTHTHTHSYTHTHTHSHEHSHTHTQTLTHTHTHTVRHTLSHSQTLIHTLMHIHTHSYPHTLTHTHIHTHAHTYTHSHTHTHIHTHTQSHTHSYTHTLTHSHTHTLSHIHSPTHTHSHTHTHTCLPTTVTHPVSPPALLPWVHSLGPRTHPLSLTGRAPHPFRCAACRVKLRPQASVTVPLDAPLSTQTDPTSSSWHNYFITPSL